MRRFPGLLAFTVAALPFRGCGGVLSIFAQPRRGVGPLPCRYSCRPMKKPTRPTLDPISIFMQGERFMQADEHLRSMQDPYLMMVVGPPALVLSAFASELFMKCIIYLETGKLERGHHLKNLFHRLSPDSRALIERLWAEYAPTQDAFWDAVENQTGMKAARDLLGCLAEGNQAFEQIRYSYEDQSNRSRFRLADLPRMLREAVLAIKPEWRGARPGFESPPTFRAR